MEAARDLPSRRGCGTRLCGRTRPDRENLSPEGRPLPDGDPAGADRRARHRHRLRVPARLARRADESGRRA